MAFSKESQLRTTVAMGWSSCAQGLEPQVPTTYLVSMSSPPSAIALRLAYGATQLPRVAWYVGHGLAMRRLAVAARRRDGEAGRRHQQANVHVPDRVKIYADMAVLLRRDLSNIRSWPLSAPRRS